MSTAARTLKDPQELYEDWERSHWAAQEIDLGRDPADWAGLEAGERELLHFALSSLMVAEERISTQFCGLVLAQDDEEEGSYLSSQLIDIMRRTGMPNGLSAVGFTEADIDQLVAGTLHQHRVTKLSPRPATEADLAAMFRDAMVYW